MRRQWTGAKPAAEAADWTPFRGGPLVGERPAWGEAEAGAEVDRAGVRMPA